MRNNPILKYIVSVEYLFLAIAVAVFYFVTSHFEWYWLPLAFIAYDITLLGYLVGPKFGALAYNITHSLIGPAALTVLYIMHDDRSLLFIILTWLFNIFFNRAIGFGLKENTGVEHTHLGKAKLHRKIVRGK